MVTTHDSRPTTPPRLAVIGGGPVGLALALLMRQRCPGWSVSVFDTRDAAKDIAGDPRTLALSLGSVQTLERLRTWPASQAAPIRQVHVSQAPPTLATPFGEPVVHIRADELGVPLLGQVPLDERLRVTADEGVPLVVAEPENATAKAVRELAVAVPAVLRPRSGAERIKKPLAVI